MKKIILAVALLMLATSVSASSVVSPALSRGWNTMSGHVSLANAGDRLLVESNGVEVFTIRPYERIVLSSGGETFNHYLVKDFDWNFQLNVLGEVPIVKIYTETNGVKTLVR